LSVLAESGWRMIRDRSDASEDYRLWKRAFDLRWIVGVNIEESNVGEVRILEEIFQAIDLGARDVKAGERFDPL